jgi:hypothetical protein
MLPARCIFKAPVLVYWKCNYLWLENNRFQLVHRLKFRKDELFCKLNLNYVWREFFRKNWKNGNELR